MHTQPKAYTLDTRKKQIQLQIEPRKLIYTWQPKSNISPTII